ncbi:MAG: energy-coupling factor transporter transmembrane component T family protein [Thermoleophilia bacterium]
MQISNMIAAQYYPGTSPMHNVDPRSKIIAAFAYVIVLFLLDSFSAMAVMAVGLAVGIALAGVPPAWLWRSTRPILFLIVFTAFFQVLLGGGTVIWQLGPIQVYREGIVNTGFLAIRLILLVLSGSILTFTTPPVLLTDALGRLMSPLAKLRLPVYELALMMTIALRFIPTLVMEVDRIIKAQKARGALSGRGPVARARGIMPVLVPLFVMSFRHADELAAAMESRCWRGGKGRTLRRKLALGGSDAVFGLAVLTMLAASLWLGKFVEVI